MLIGLKGVVVISGWLVLELVLKVGPSHFLYFLSRDKMYVQRLSQNEKLWEENAFKYKARDDKEIVILELRTKKISLSVTVVPI